MEETVSGFVSKGNPGILLEHDLRVQTVEVAKAVSKTICEAGFVNCPISALFGDQHRYLGTNLTWPVVENGIFEPSFNPINGLQEK